MYSLFWFIGGEWNLVLASTDLEMLKGLEQELEQPTWIVGW